MITAAILALASLGQADYMLVQVTVRDYGLLPRAVTSRTTVITQQPTVTCVDGQCYVTPQASTTITTRRPTASVLVRRPAPPIVRPPTVQYSQPIIRQPPTYYVPERRAYYGSGCTTCR